MSVHGYTTKRSALTKTVTFYNSVAFLSDSRLSGANGAFWFDNLRDISIHFLNAPKADLSQPVFAQERPFLLNLWTRWTDEA
ncbi:hypothetical protein RRG08_015770 [Elysia crispata]|uniref:Uncharacterized protein n=1 Tax=Elysia crispata TaxID=231223 RepID=A0AAE1D1L0_9GAST|nr:hypothetical protein RRG08_015770 [Elysia crispata]